MLAGLFGRKPEKEERRRGMPRSAAKCRGVPQEVVMCRDVPQNAERCRSASENAEKCRREELKHGGTAENACGYCEDGANAERCRSASENVERCRRGAYGDGCLCSRELLYAEKNRMVPQEVVMRRDVPQNAEGCRSASENAERCRRGAYGDGCLCSRELLYAEKNRMVPQEVVMRRDMPQNAEGCRSASENVEKCRRGELKHGGTAENACGYCEDGANAERCRSASENVEKCRREQRREAEKWLTILHNVSVYDGTGRGQKIEQYY